MGLAVGLVVGALVLPSILRLLDLASSEQLLFVTVGILVGTAFVGQALGLFIGTRLHATLPGSSVRSVDRAAGAGAGLVGVIVAIWILLPLMADVPGWFAAQARGSTLAAWVEDRLPDPPDTVDSLRRLIGDEQFGRVFSDVFERAPDLGPPPSTTNIPQAVVNAVVPSTVKVEGIACSTIQQGSGFVVGPGLVVTNAHVVAGEDETIVERSDGSEVRAEVVAFDPNRDLAVLRADDLGRPALVRRTIEEGGVGAVFGHPGGEAAPGGPLPGRPAGHGHRHRHLRPGADRARGADPGVGAAPRRQRRGAHRPVRAGRGRGLRDRA